MNYRLTNKTLFPIEVDIEGKGNPNNIITIASGASVQVKLTSENASVLMAMFKDSLIFTQID